MAEVTKTLTYRFGADFGQMARDMAKGEELARKQQREFAALQKQQREHRQTMVELGQGATLMGAMIVAGFAVSAKAAIEWESEFAGVKKTVDGTPEQIAQLEGELRQLARTLPATHQEIAAVAEAAGQLGIKRQDVAAFTKVMIDLGNTTNLTAEDAATSLAKLSNIMGTTASDVDRLGSTLVALGNDGASTEKDILDMALRIAGAGKLIGLTEAQVLGFASALSSVGINAEAGGSSISRVMKDIQGAVLNGGEKLAVFAKTAGQTSTQFAASFRDDAGAAVLSFIAGLDKVQKTGGNVLGVLDQLGLSDIIVSDTLLRASSSSDVLTKSLQVGAKGWAENKALTDEAGKRYETTASKLMVAGNQVKDAMIDIGAAVVPMIADITSGISDVVQWWQQLPGPLKDVVTWAGVATAGLTLFGGAALIVVPKIFAFREAMSGLVATGGAMSGFLGRAGLMLAGPWGAGIALGVAALGLFGAAQASASKEVAKFTFDIDRQTGKLSTSGFEQFVKEIADGMNVIGDDESSARVKDVLRDIGVSAADMTSAIAGVPDALDKVNEAIARGGASSQAAKVFLEEHTKKYNEQRDAAKDAMAGAKEYATSQGDVKDATKETIAAQQEQARLTKELTDKVKETKKAFDDLVDAMNAANGITLTYREEQRAYREQLTETAAALAKNGKGLDENTAAGVENARALDAQAEAAGKLAEAAAREAEKTGGVTAANAAFSASLAASRGELIAMAEKFGMSAPQAQAYADSVLAGVAANKDFSPTAAQVQIELQKVRDKLLNIPPGKEINVGVLSADAIAELEKIKGIHVTTQANGTVVVRADTAAALQSIAALQARTVYVDLVYVDRGIARSTRGGLTMAEGGIVTFARGGVVRSYAGGGIEDHQPQFARAIPGTARVWAEDETGGETYLPWRMDKRQKATQYLKYTANEWGYDLVPRTRQVAAFAGGGMWGAAVPGSVGGSGQLTAAAVGQAVATAVAATLAGSRLELGDGFARFVRLNTAANGRR